MHAQTGIQISFDPGYYLYNSDNVFKSSDKSALDWTFGGHVSLLTGIKGLPVELSAGLLQGTSTFYSFQRVIGIPLSFSAKMTYRALPIELLLMRDIGSGLRLSGGINITAHHRIITSKGAPLPDDRLFSLGAGLTGRIQTDILTFASGSGSVFLNLTVRWTEYLYHHSRGRIMDDFTLRHLVVSPRIGVALIISDT
jgi:hypothetical protein